MPQSATAAIIEKVNARIDGLLNHQEDETYKPYVCIICDKFLKPSTLQVIQEKHLQKCAPILRCDGFAELPPHHDVVKDYLYEGDHSRDWMKDVLLSPRASYLGKGRGKGSVCGYSACTQCKTALLGKTSAMPTYAIANKYYFGTPPSALLDLNDVELALLTPVRAYGFVFTYSGGRQRNLKGVLSYYRIEESDIANAVMQLEVLGLNKHVVVLYTGEFTPEQMRKAREACGIRVDKVLNAVRELVDRHRLWGEVDLERIREELLETGPIIIDESSSIDESTDPGNSNVERMVSFAAYFPDGTMKALSGGQESIGAFKSLVERSKYHMQDLQFQCKLKKEAVADFHGDNFLKASLLQFPYAFGGMNERRLKPDGSSTSTVDLTEYVRHLSHISQPHFHRPLFVLILYSIYQRQLMFQSSRLNVRGDVNYTNFATALNADDIDEAIAFRRAQHEQRRNGGTGPPVSGGTFISNKYLNTVDAVTRALPHTDGCARRARTEGECVCHHIGFPTFFLSLTPDDEASFLLQIYSCELIDDEIPVDYLTDEVLAERAKKRRELRIKAPGLCAFVFEILLEIVLEEVVGIDVRNNKILDKGGYFGKVQAAMVTVEEQGRLSLHAHILLWVPRLKKMLELVQDADQTERNQNRARAELADSLRQVATTNLIGDATKAQLIRMFKHECSGPRHQTPSSVDDQQLRNLRHREGCRATEYNFAVCESCGKTWTNEDIVQLYLREGLRLPNFTSYPDNCRRLNARCVEFQKPSSSGTIPAIVNAAYNSHFSFHTKTCFPCDGSSNGRAKKKKKKQTRKRKRNEDECRMRLPDRKRRRTCVSDVKEVPWYRWDGTPIKKKIVEVNPRRGEFDQFQNVSCPAISQSKMTCNSNIKIISPGPVVIYVTKYAWKDTQRQDTEPYSAVSDVTRRVLSDDRKHPTDRSEALRRILCASFAHNKTNVVGPAMASWLTRNGTRFLISKDFAWCPLRDLNNLLKNAGIRVTVRSFDGKNFFKNAALHYLCRPHELEDVDVFTFYTEYETRYISTRKKETKKDDNDNDDAEVLPFENNDHFQHPSYKVKQDRMAQGVRRRELSAILKLHQWYFPDAAQFEASILDETTTITPKIEEYARLVLLLFLPFRKDDDLRQNGSCARKLRSCFQRGEIRQFAFEYLQNVQDGRSNALRHGAIEDELARTTIPFQATEDGFDHEASDDDDGDDDAESVGEALDDAILDDLIDSMFLSAAIFDDEHETPSNLDLSMIMEKGTRQCGFDKVVDVSPPRATGNSANPNWQSAFVQTQHADPPASAQQDDDADNRQSRFDAQRPKSRQQIVKTILNYRTLRERKFPTFSEDDAPVEVRPANGTAASIINWARQANLDGDQRRSFEVLASAFVLTFYDDANNKDARGTQGGRFRAKYRKLNCLSGRSAAKENLVAFIHGPGGAGKSAVIDLLILYCSEYCHHLDYPFDQHTIVVTALTGVAATHVMGETTHRATHLCQKRDFLFEQIDDWKLARLLVVDEISFAPPWLFDKLDTNMRTLRDQLHKRYGGLNIVFCGDLRQLKPIRDDSVADVKCIQFHDWCNCYIELNGRHRFRNDPRWGEILFRFRSGVPTTADISEINKRLCRSETELPPSLRYATFTNKDRDAINTAVFSKYCASTKDQHTGAVPSALVVLSDNLTVMNSKGSYIPVKQRRTFWQVCGEDDVLPKDTSKGRVDPVVKLYRNCPIMLTSNDNVRGGKANGTRALVENVLLKRGENHFDLNLGRCTVPAVFASQIEHVRLRHENPSVRPQRFALEPRKYSVYAFFPKPGSTSTAKINKDRMEMKFNQLPIISNTATTGHKLQGSSVDCIFVQSWNYKDNWPYVVLSRVRTIDGLFLREPLSYDLKRYAMSPKLVKFVERFRARSTRPIPSDEQYQWMESNSDVENGSGNPFHA